MPIYFALHGSAFLIKLFGTDHELYKATKDIPENLLHSTIFEEENFKKLNLNLKSIWNIKSDLDYFLYKTDMQTRIEIKTKNKRHKLFFKEIVRDDLLFQSSFILSKSEHVIPNNSLMIIEEHIGNFGEQIIQTENFKPDFLKAEIISSEISNRPLVGNLYYNKALINFRNSEILNTALMLRRK